MSSTIFQVGAGSGGMPVLDLLCRDERVRRVILVEPDVYKPHNVHRHLFPPADVGQSKAKLARRWLLERRPDLDVALLEVDLLDPAAAGALDEAASEATIGICAADTEAAKYHFDSLMRRQQKPWTLGEVLSGGIGGFVHGFVPGGPCYGCVASHLKRSVQVDKPPTPDYAQPGGPVHEVTIPATKTSISVIAGLHAQITLQLLAAGNDYDPGFTSMLFTLERVPGIFEEAFKPYKFRIPRSPECLMCRPQEWQAQDLDAALERALGRLGHA
jgi:molybdopterin/thiamine biosynthesis adenylyltransferase